MTILTIATLFVSLLAGVPTGTVTALAIAAQEKTAPAPAQERDPVCGMTVDAAKAKAAGRASDYQGKTYYFCNDSCKKHFDDDPAKYAQKQTGDQASAGSGCCCCGSGQMRQMPQAGQGGQPAMSGGMCCRRR